MLGIAYHRSLLPSSSPSLNTTCRCQWALNSKPGVKLTHSRARTSWNSFIAKVGRSSTGERCPAGSVVKHRVSCRSSLSTFEAVGNKEGSQVDWKLLLWSTLDVTATLGSIGGAVAFILTQEAMLIGLPVILPLLALYASRRRESIKVQVQGFLEIESSDSTWQAAMRQLLGLAGWPAGTPAVLECGLAAAGPA